MAPSIVIDPGHGGYDSGAQFEGRKEKDDVLRLALAVGELLKERGYTVYYTRTTDTYDSPLEKARIANETNGDYFISFHRNSSPRPNTYQGVESLVYEENEVVNAIANGINRQLEQVGIENLGIEERPGLVVLRRTKREENTISFDDLTVDMGSRKVYRGGEKINLTPKEYALLEVLITHRNLALSREKLISMVWTYDYEGDTRTVDVHIQQLRQKLGLKDRIKTIYKVGYRLEL